MRRVVGVAAASLFGVMLVMAVWGWAHRDNMAGHVMAEWTEPITNSSYGFICFVMALGVAAGLAALR